MKLLAVLFIIGVTGWSLGQPILPGVPYQSYPPYQIVYLTPPQVPYQMVREPQQVLSNRVSNEGDDSISEEISPIVPSEDDDSDEQFEVSQFHSEDEHGRVVFGFHSPDQIRMEARDSDGTVRGSYSYIDANGNIVRMHYWDDGSGFHAAGNNLPVAVHQVPEYTPEVQAAREEHFRLYEAALATLQSAMSPSAENDGDDTPDTVDYAEQPSYSDGDSDSDSPSDDTVIIENGVPQHEQRPEYPKIPQFIQPGNYFPDQLLDDDKESVAIENPEFRSQLPQWVVRQAKSETKEVNKKPIEPKVSETKGEKKITKSETPIAIEKKIDLLPNGGGEYDPITKEITGGDRAFFYHFKHLVPLEKTIFDNSPMYSSSVSAKAKHSGGIPVAAVHDSQVSPSQKDSIPNVQVYPVYNPKQVPDHKKN